jgi:DNA-binding LacI/PurR family transcriptional regulator
LHFLSLLFKLEKSFMPKNSVTAKDVAELAGVSQSTVSRVLSARDEINFISEKTAERVRAAAAQLNYSPNPIARALRGEHTHLIGLVIREIADPFFAQLVAKISAQARERNYGVILGDVHSDPVEALSITRAFDERQMDGVICLGDLRNDTLFLRSLLDSRHPVVALCRGLLKVPVPTVNCNNSEGIAMLLDHLYALGHRRFAFLDGGWLGDIRTRREAFMNYFAERNLKSVLTSLQADSNSFQGGYDAMSSILNLSPRPTAVLASDDQMAIGALRAANHARLRVPEDISITGFDGIDLASFMVPSITTVRQPIEQMASQALELILMQIQHETIPEEEMYIEVMPEIVIQESTGPAPAAN